MDDASAHEELVAAWQDAAQAAELTERLTDAATHAWDAEPGPAPPQEVARLAVQTASAAERAAQRARAALARADDGD